MKNFSSEFNTLSYIIGRSDKILLFAHSNPDGDAVGSVFAFKEYLESLGKIVDVGCTDPLPSYFESLTEYSFEFPENLDFSAYDAAIGCDSVEHGFHTIFHMLDKKTVTVFIDHHPDITMGADVVIIDPKLSSTCEILYEYLISQDAHITKSIATYLMIGILGDTGNFQHANTTSRVMEISADLLKKGASVPRIIQSTLANKKMSTLKLWGRAFEKAKINKANGMIVTVLTNEDIEECHATTEDIGQVSSILNTVPGTKFALVLSERENGLIKGSLRSEEYKGVDVSQIAHQFGGGGHKLASGFEIKGQIVEAEDGWKII